MNYQHPRLTFDESTHSYKWDGVVKPSVTQILSAVAVNGKPVCDTRFFGTDTTARDFGNAFHKIAAFAYRGEGCEIPDVMLPWAKSFFKFKEEYSFLRPIYIAGGIPLIETPMYEETLGYALTPDLICEAIEPCPIAFRRAIVTLDWKTAVQEMGHWQFQTAGYSGAIKKIIPEIFNGKHEITMAVRVDEKAYHPKTRIGNEVKADWNYFLSCLNVYKGAV